MTQEDQDLVLQLINNQLAALSKVRIPELPPYSNSGDAPTLNDAIPIWRQSTNKTVQTSLQVLKALFVNPSEQVLDPQLMGNTIFVTATSVEAGTNVFNIPSIAGKEFVLRREGYGGLEVGVDYEILSSGGFKLLPEENLIQLGEKFELQLVGSNGGIIEGGGSAGPLFTGAVTIATSLTLNPVNHKAKLLQLRPAAVGMITTLPDVLDTEENTIWVFEAMIGAYESKINTSSGQYIYWNGSSVLEMYVRPGEYVWFYRGDDGWYVIDYDPRMLMVLKEVMFGYTVEDDEIECAGGTYAKSLYPRAWKKIQTFGTSLVSEAVWQTASAVVNGKTIDRPYRGCFADVDTNTFRAPDYRDMFIRGLGTDSSQRFFNNPGGYQIDALKDHVHRDNVGTPGGTPGIPGTTSGSSGTEIGTDGITSPADAGYTETRGKNIGLKVKMKI